MALVEMDFAAGIGGNNLTINDFYAGTGASSLSFDESDYALIGLGSDQTFTTEEFFVVSKGETKTLETTGTYGTKVIFTFASDGKSASWTKSSGYGNFAFFAVSIN